MNEDYGKYGFEDLDYGNRVLMSGQIIGYVDDDNAVKHLGYEPDIDDEQERMKLVNRTSVMAGDKALPAQQAAVRTGRPPTLCQTQVSSGVRAGRDTFFS